MITNDLRIILAERYITKTDFAKDTGISRKTITAICNNKITMIRLETINTICNKLDITPTEFFNYVPDTNEEE